MSERIFPPILLFSVSACFPVILAVTYVYFLSSSELEVSSSVSAQLTPPPSSDFLELAKDPLVALPLSEKRLAQKRSPQTLEEYAEVLSALKRHSEAVSLRTEALSLRSAKTMSVTDLVMAYSHIAQELQGARRYDEALGTITLARKAAGAFITPSVDAVLIFIESALLDCKGDAMLALIAFEAAEGKAGITANRYRRSDEDTLRYLDLVKKVIDLHPPPGPAKALRARARELTHSLIAKGPWDSPWQLPREYVPGLRSAPWYDVATSPWPSTRQAVSILEAAPLGQLQEEYRSLAAKGHLLDETECIHTGEGYGTWRWFATNGYWTVRDESGCAVVSPVACGIVRQIERDVGLRVRRAGYSAIDKKAYLRPHHGWTNTQLKFHLGVIVPSGCMSNLTVGNETRHWEEGKVLFFDDSFQHSVRHACDQVRVIFQVVFTHPDFKDHKVADSTKREALQRHATH